MKPEPDTKNTFLNRLNYLYKPQTRFAIQTCLQHLCINDGNRPQCPIFRLAIASRDADPEKRTSLDLTPDKSLVSQKLELSFDLTFVPNNPTYFGYVSASLMIKAKPGYAV